ncbi:fructose-bisphosphatase, class II [Haemophilus paracuniculus]|uniref:Fructose-1,6-bisphosphatase n=1 Tax=Haemophilus paracuniculus TaxID=734 RepID=A0A1T0ASE4_9PAST|nr:class II fructose-bisphosphatase [Haemophilus paracuniculus]OOR99306.1 fructose-bisphosphatase, class II [Haemophilus paracuniculus]
MNKTIALSFAQVTEAAAIAAFDWVGRGNKNLADEAAVKAMREQLNQMPIDGEIVIGEGEIDEAPMLYIGERVGNSQAGSFREESLAVDIAVDPIDGTRMTAMGQANALAVLAAGKRGCFLNAPDMYMEKLVVGKALKGLVDLNLPLVQNLQQIAERTNRPLADLCVAILAKPRHDQIIAELQQLGVKVVAFPDGDVAVAVQCCLPNSQIDLMYGIGGAPEGVVAAVAVRALGGDMQARLLPRDVVKGNSPENVAIAEQEIARCQAMKVAVNQVLALEQLVSSDEVVFCATGITHGDLVRGVEREQNRLCSETLVIEGNGSIHRLRSSRFV